MPNPAFHRPPSVFSRVVLPFLVVLLIVAGIQTWRSQRPPAAPQVITLAEPAPATATAAAPAAAAATPAVAASSAPAALPLVSAWVVYAGQDIAVEKDNISLPSGAGFAVKVQSSVDGELAFFTINPQGVSASQPLWTRAVRAGVAETGPNLRLEGSRGLETLRVVLRPAAGGDAIEQHVQIWHQ